LGDWTNLDFPIHQSQSLSSKLQRWKLENPKISQLPKILPITQKSPNFQSNRQSLISEVQKLSNLEGTLPQDWLKLEHYSSLSLGSLTPRRNDGMNSREYWLFQESVYRASSSQK
jgi:hypothetical protein